MGDWTPPDRRFSELPVRLASALVLIPLALGAVWMGGVWLAAGCAVFAVIMMLEWCAMSATPHGRLLAAMAGAFVVTLPFASLELSLAIAAATVVLGIAGSRRFWKSRVTGGFGPIYVLSMVGMLYLLREGPWDGRAAALLFMSFVWVSDASAYFFGRALNGPKLLPSESPNKTWSGAISALIACAICGYFAAGIEGVDQAVWIITGILVSIVAQAGDLFESGLKRRFKVKDSGHILPGHGGLLDRVDGLGAVSVVASCALLMISGFPEALGF